MKSTTPNTSEANGRLFKQLAQLSEQDLKKLHVYIDDLIWRKRFTAFARSVSALEKTIAKATRK